MAKITWTNKTALNPQPSIARENKCTDADLNEIKQVVNTNDDNVGTLSNLDTTDKSSIVNAINEIAGWTLKDSKTGASAISLPSSYKEILVIVKSSDTARNWNIGVFSHDFISNLNNALAFRSGHYSSNSDYSDCAVWIRTNNVELASAGFNGSNITSGCTTYVYYK